VKIAKCLEFFAKVYLLHLLYVAVDVKITSYIYCVLYK